MRTVVVVAHPDDETLWAGGYLAAHPGTDVICCSVPKKDPQRIAHFFEACKMLGANPIVLASSLAENDNVLELGPVQRFVVAGFVTGRYELVLTHNALGEYGHPHHIQVHHAMLALRRLTKLLVFGYGYENSRDRYNIEWTDVDIELKRRVLAVYTSRPEVFKRQSAKFDLSKEAFL